MDCPNTSEILNAISKVGECLLFSIAIIVCRVTPTNSASSFCVISSAKKRSSRILFLIIILAKWITYVQSIELKEIF